MRRAVFAATLFLLAAGARAQDLQIGVNDAFDPAGTAYGVDEVGWFYTPTISFTFNEIRTRFHSSPINPTNGQPILFELRSQVFDTNNYPQPGALLRSVTFGASTTLAGGTFDDFQMSAGQTYFFGFRGVDGLGVNVADDDNREIVGHMRYSNASTGTYVSEEGSGVTDSPILQLYGGPAMIPEPGSLALLTLPTAFFLRRRKR